MARISELLGKDADSLLNHRCTTIDQSLLHLPGPDFVDRVSSPRPIARSRCCATCSRSSATAVWPGPGTCPSFPWTRASSTAPAPRSRPIRSTSIPKTSSAWPSKAAATPSPRRSACSERWRASYAHKIPFLMKLNHNELLTYPNKFDQIMFAHVQQAADMGCAAVGATIYFGSEESDRQIQEVSVGLPARPRARHGDGAVVLPAQQRLQEGRRRLSRRRRPHEPGEPSRRHDRSRHHQAEGPGEQRRLHGVELRQDQQARLRASSPATIRSI